MLCPVCGFWFWPKRLDAPITTAMGIVTCAGKGLGFPMQRIEIEALLRDPAFAESREGMLAFLYRLRDRLQLALTHVEGLLAVADPQRFWSVAAAVTPRVEGFDQPRRPGLVRVPVSLFSLLPKKTEVSGW